MGGPTLNVMTVTERAPLTRQRVADAALALIDDQGLEGLSMRKLGASLGVEAMSLYNHVSNKDDLLHAVTDELYVKILGAYGEPKGDWRSKARRMAAGYVHVAAEHPNAIPLLVERPVATPRGQEFMGRVVLIFDDATDDMRLAALAFSVASSWVVGTLVQEQNMVRQLAADPAPSRPTVDASTLDGSAPEDTALARFREAYASVLSSEERVSDGLEAVLDGIESRYFST